MGNFRCELLEHTVNPVGEEAVSYGTCYERFIHAEVMTHGAWNRNASSARAIPYERMKKWTMSDPALPLHLGRNQSGMQSGNQIDDPDACYRDLLQMLEGMYLSSDVLMAKYDLHKEIINRYTEPWAWINFVMTTGRPGLMNFFHLRCTKYAHPNIQRLAVTMARLYRASTPRKLAVGEWHMPFVTAEERETLLVPNQIVWSTARCAWTSYQTVEGKKATYEQAQKRHDDCVSLKHMTPCGHQLQARGDHGRNGGQMAGYDQYRHMIPEESAKEFDFGLLDTIYADRDFVVP